MDPLLPLLEDAVEPDPDEVPEPEPELCVDEVPELCELVVVRLVTLLFPLLSPPPNSRFFPPSTKKAITAITISSSFPLHPPRPMPMGTPPRRLVPELCVPPGREVEECVEPVAGRDAEGRVEPVAGLDPEGREAPCVGREAFCAACWACPKKPPGAECGAEDLAPPCAGREVPCVAFSAA